MTQSRKITWIAVGIFALGLWYLSKNKRPSVDQSTLNNDLKLAKGSKGAEVFELQKLLLEKHNAYLGETGENHDGVDGDFGNFTEQALKNFKGVTEITLNQFNKM
jgi:hypothetical protein